MNTPLPAKKYGTADAIAFLNGTGKDAAGRTVEDYLKFDAAKWEECHNHVQWAFPSHVTSMFNPDAPVVDMAALESGLSITGYHNVTELIKNYMASLGITVIVEPGLPTQFHYDWNSPRGSLWLSPRNHNYLRLTRLLNLLYWLEEGAAHELLSELLVIAEGVRDYWMPQQGPFIDTQTVIFWAKSAIGKL